MTVKMGDQVINVDTNTVSLGGVSFNSDMKAEKGEKISIRLADLDQEVEGEVVWCSQKQSFGVRFLNITDELKSQMNIWTAGLNPS